MSIYNNENVLFWKSYINFYAIVPTSAELYKPDSALGPVTRYLDCLHIPKWAYSQNPKSLSLGSIKKLERPVVPKHLQSNFARTWVSGKVLFYHPTIILNLPFTQRFLLTLIQFSTFWAISVSSSTLLLRQQDLVTAFNCMSTETFVGIGFLCAGWSLTMTDLGYHLLAHKTGLTLQNNSLVLPE